MPPSRADRRLLVFTGVLVVIAAVMVALLLLVATGRGGSAGAARPLFLGLEGPLTKKIDDGGPLYFASPFAGNGFWLDVEDRHLVALVLDRPGRRDCVVKWKAQRNAYIDCDGHALSSRDLDRYQLTVGPRNGSPRTSVYVDLRKASPAPATAGSG